jgi:membrane-bound metal-dependent hydrolase YbcI (DUF457 family)
MTGLTHMAGGVLAGAAIGGDYRITVAALAALVPDWLQINVPGGSSLARGLFGHRGISHWLITAVGVAVAVALISPSLAVYVLAGWSSHIVLDVLSNGAPALWPLPRITLARIKSGGWMDALIGGALLTLAVVILLVRLLR